MKKLTKLLLLPIFFMGHSIFASSIAPATLPITMVHNTNTNVVIEYSGDKNYTYPKIPQDTLVEGYGKTVEIATMDAIPGNYFSVSLWTDNSDGVTITRSCYYRITIDPEGIAHTHPFHLTKTPYACNADNTTLTITDQP